MLEGYGTGITSRALLKSNRAVDANNAPIALSVLECIRFAIREGIPVDAELDELLIKDLTGGDKINLKRNFGKHCSFENHAKLNLSGNYLPRIENVSDDEFSCRIFTMPFNVRFDDHIAPADPLIKEKMLLPESLSGLFSLLVREAVAWYREGPIISSRMNAMKNKLLGQSFYNRL